MQHNLYIIYNKNKQLYYLSHHFDLDGEKVFVYAYVELNNKVDLETAKTIMANLNLQDWAWFDKEDVVSLPLEDEVEKQIIFPSTTAWNLSQNF